MRAAVLVVSPIAAKAALDGTPTSAANTWPRLIPICNGRGGSAIRIAFAARSMRPSSSSLVRGTPELEKILPALTSQSTHNMAMSSAMKAAWTILSVSWSALARASTPCDWRISSVPEKRMNEIVAIRCAGSGRVPSRTSARIFGTSCCADSASVERSRNRPLGATGAERQRRSSAPSLRGRTEPRGKSAASALLTTIWPASAAFSHRMAVVVSGPSTTSSRCGAPTSIRWNLPAWTPVETFRLSRPTEVRISDERRSSARISIAVEQACSA